MKKGRKKRLMLCVIVFCATCGFLALFKSLFIINGTNSLPGYLYLKKKVDTIHQNDQVAACPADPFIKIGLILDTLFVSRVIPSPCNFDTQPVLKIVAAVPGDHVFADGIHDIKINGVAFRGSAPHKDSYMPKFQFKGYVKENQYLLLTPFYDSFDGRYWGFTPRENIKNKIIKVF